MNRPITRLALGLLVAATGFLLHASAFAQTVTLSPLADGSVRNGAFSEMNFGSAAVLPAKTGSGVKRQVFLKFSLSDVDDSYNRAILRVYGSRGASVIGPTATTESAYGAMSENWTEKSLTWLSRPATGPLLDSVTVESQVPQYYEWDVTSFVLARKAAGSSTVTLVIAMEKLPSVVGSPDVFNSRESAANRPELVLSTLPVLPPNAPADPTPVPTATPIPTPTPSPTAPPIPRSNVTFSMGSDGLSSVQYEGREYLTNNPRIYPTFGGTLGRVYVNSNGVGLPYDSTMQINGSTITQRYVWGVVTTTYSAVGNALEITQTVENRSSLTIDSSSTVPIRITTPDDAVMDSWSLQSNTNEPIVNTLNFASGAVAFCDLDVAQASIKGFCNVESPREWIVKMEGGRSPENPYNIYAFNPITPGDVRTTKFQIRFGGVQDNRQTLGADVFTKFGQAFPMQVDWTDKRALGVDFIANEDVYSRTNPRGYLKDDQVDVTTPSGRSAFAAALLRRADNDLANLATIHAQGIIIWDLEGAELPQDTSYIGDPRICETLAPELATPVKLGGVTMKVVDAFFKKFTDAGYRVGITLRPQLLQQDGVPVINLAPGRFDSSKLIAQTELGERGLNDEATAALLVEKINYAKARWGCTIFYCDSIWMANGRIFELVRQQVPDVLISPENGLPRAHASTAPYATLLGSEPGLGADEFAAYPTGFNLTYAADGNPSDDPKKAAAVRRAVSAGECILLGRVWFPSQELEQIKAAYGY